MSPKPPAELIPTPTPLPTPTPSASASIEVLTQDEQQAALQAARDAKQQRLADEDARARQEALATRDEALARAERKLRPQQFAGIDHGSGDVAYVEFPAERERLIHLGGQTCEHVDTDREGVWIYRVVR